MIAHKHISKIVSALMVVAVCLCLCATAFRGKIETAVASDGISMEYETELFDTETPIEVNIIMNDDDWKEMLSNAMSEEYSECDVEINGTTFYRVGIRPKGNTSLSSIASDPETDRYSFKLEFDHYVDGQTCFGLDKLILNNNYADATNMKEALVYDMFGYVGADASLYNYAKINVNGEYWGVYVALEAVEDSFLLRNYGVQSGELYKPESMNIGNGKGGGQDFKNADFPASLGSAEEKEETTSAAVLSVSKDAAQDEGGENSSASKEGLENEKENVFENIPQGGFSMSSGGADLNYTDDELDSYSTIWDGEVTDSNKADHKRVVTALKNIAEGTELEEYMDIDNLVRYMAVHVFSVNDDSLSGTMAHNYYLYESNGKLNLIPWDYNLSFGGMGGSGNATSVVNEAIDNAFSATDFFDTLTENEEYNALYYDNLKKVVEYINNGEFDEFYNRVRNTIDSLVETDPNAFYEYDEYVEAAETLYKLVKLRGESIEKQLSGTIPSTSELQKNSDSLVDASESNLSVLGSMGGGNKGGFDIKNVSAEGGEDSSKSENASAAATQNGAVPPEAAGENGSPPEKPSGDAPNVDFSGGNAPNGVEPPSANGEAPSAPSQNEESTTENAQSENEGTTAASGDSSDETTSESESSDSRSNSNGENQFDFEPKDGFPGGDRENNFSPDLKNDSSSIDGKNLAVYGICFGIMLLFLLFAALYKRRPGKG